MKPIGPLMREHRLIERIVPLMKREIGRYESNQQVNLEFIDSAVDFFKTYADRTHHGKEEEILFRKLKKKELSLELSKTMYELIEEHETARKAVQGLVKAKERHVDGEASALNGLIVNLNKLIKLYPEHIEKEDKRFFYPCMEYFSREELDSMLDEFWEFDRTMIHEKYKIIIENLETATDKRG